MKKSIKELLKKLVSVISLQISHLEKVKETEKDEGYIEGLKSAIETISLYIID